MAFRKGGKLSKETLNQGKFSTWRTVGFSWHLLAK